MTFIEWLKSFPIDEDGTPSGKITPGLYWAFGLCAIITLILVLLCRLL